MTITHVPKLHAVKPAKPLAAGQRSTNDAQRRLGVGESTTRNISSMRLLVASIVLAGFVIALYVLTRPDKAVEVQGTTSVEAPTVRLPIQVHVPEATPPDAWQATAHDLEARAKRDELLARIRDARAGHESWNEQGLALLDLIGRRAIATSDVGCYMAGCSSTFTFVSETAYRRAFDEVTTTSEYARWTGGKQFTDPEALDGGRVVVAVVLQRPD